MNIKGNILVSSISDKIPLIKDLRKSIESLKADVKIIGADASTNITGKYFVDQFWNMPSLNQLNVVDLLEYCNNNDIVYIIPTRDGELSYFAEHKSFLLEHGIHVMVSDPNVIEICNNKFLFYEKDATGLCIPTYDDIENFSASSYVVKENSGAGSLDIGVNLSKSKAIEKSQTFNSPIFQPYMSGSEVSVDLYISLTNEIYCLTRYRSYVKNGESVITSAFHNKNIENKVMQFVRQFCFYGHIVIQLILNEQGVHIIECNPRFGGASSLSIACGLDSFTWFLLESNGLSIPQNVNLEYSLTQVRYADNYIFKR
ncbi:MAG: ATP-grasp domain-containing protein [Marinifilaceae bacterium]|jgi:carbamoyl-phosphate synthase large subunit|nr:ATP-grasp domain-containing protein [Marinifilaceae bacterium]